MSQTELQRFAMRWYGIEELKLLLKNIGFIDITCSADYVYKKQRSNKKIVLFWYYPL